MFLLQAVAQLVARQFRVLEAASSSPATSTKKRTDSPCGYLFFFSFGRSGISSSSPLRKAQNASSHIPLKDRQACLSGAERGYIQLCWKSRHPQYLPRVLRRLASIVVARRSTSSLLQLLVSLGRVAKNSYQLFFPRLPATSTKTKSVKSLDFTRVLALFVFLFFAIKTP